MAWFGLVEDDPTKKKAEQVVQKPQEGPTVSAAPVIQLGSSSEEFMAKIMEQIKGRAGDNTYFKLRAGMDVLIAGKLDEVSAAKGAAAILGAQIQAVVNISNVGPAIDEAIALITSEKEGFMTSIYKQAVDKADALTTHASDVQAQINILLEQVKQLSEENINTQQEASKAHGEAEVLAATFDASASKLTNILIAEKQKLTTYLS